MNRDIVAPRHDRLHDLLGELAAAQWAVEDAVMVVDGGLPIDLTDYLTARARLDLAVTVWNLRVVDRPSREVPRVPLTPLASRSK
ncbi:hypothetical protein [Krasilnikoviella flava]|uniref:Uncharacterized protein n=1 Tax=Krasilnikoviella flava TaxID=526729 RepID=A0A1T5KYS6_9MICO|nr:hypothetical protein [Krasilnikoviella flava]SKC68874.1 hypothetical protein SAMN04324258_2642 [Krasilnikoviella flava]